MFGAPVFPSSGLGNIAASMGTTNASGGAGFVSKPAAATGSTPINWMPFLGMNPNLPRPAQPQPMQPPPAQPMSGTQASIGQMMAQLHPQAQQALRAIPRDTMEHLTRAGIMHPDLMGHLYGGAQR